MNDEQINRLVATMIVRAFDPGAAPQMIGVPAYCTDPAAWGALLVWLAGEGRGPRLIYDKWIDGYAWRAVIHPDRQDETISFRGQDSLPGRALALATLRAYGVEVTE